MTFAGTSHSLVARRYAEALFELAEGQSLDAVARDLGELRAMIAASADLRHAVSSPVIPGPQRVAAIEAVAASAGFGDLTKRFLGVVSKNNRLFFIDAIATAFLDEVAARRGLKQVELTSARPPQRGPARRYRGRAEPGAFRQNHPYRHGRSIDPWRPCHPRRIPIDRRVR